VPDDGEEEREGSGRRGGGKEKRLSTVEEKTSAFWRKERREERLWEEEERESLSVWKRGEERRKFSMPSLLCCSAILLLSLPALSCLSLSWKERGGREEEEFSSMGGRECLWKGEERWMGCLEEEGKSLFYLPSTCLSGKERKEESLSLRERKCSCI